MKIFYHNDLDGRCGAAIIYQSESDRSDVEYIEMEYGKTYPLERVEKEETVVIIDFSFEPEYMAKLLEITSKVIWIDHHKTAIEKLSDFSSLYGKRDVNFSGCELVWQYLDSSDTTDFPRAVAYIGDRDKWAWKYGKDTAWFNEGLRSYDPLLPSSPIWKKLLDSSEEASKVVDNIIKTGKICLRYRDAICKDYREQYGFASTFEGHNCFCQGLYTFGSEAFGELMDEYPICLSFEFNGDLTMVGLYSKTIDVSEIAKKYGGGGHSGASGFATNRLHFYSNPDKIVVE